MTGQTAPQKTRTDILEQGLPKATAEQTAALTDWAAGVDAADIPDAVYRQAAVVVCDNLTASSLRATIRCCRRFAIGCFATAASRWRGYMGG